MSVFIAAYLSIASFSGPYLHDSEEGFFQGAKPSSQKMGTIGGRFGLWDMKDAEGDGMFSELYLDAPVGGDLYVEFRLGAGGESETGLVNIYMGVGMLYDIRLGKARMSDSDVEFSFRPSAYVLWAYNDIELDAESNYDALQMGLRDVAVSTDSSFGFCIGGQLVMTRGRVDTSFFLGYNILETEATLSGTASGVPVKVSDEISLSGVIIGVSIGLRF